MDLLCRPASEMTAAVQEDFEQADDAGVVDLDAGIANRTNSDRQGQALEQREVDMDIEPLGLEAGEAGGDGLEALAHGLEMVQPLLEAEIGEIVGDQLVACHGIENVPTVSCGLLSVTLPRQADRPATQYGSSFDSPLEGDGFEPSVPGHL